MRNAVGLIRFAKSSQSLNFLRISDLTERLSLPRLVANEKHFASESKNVHLLARCHRSSSHNLHHFCGELCHGVWLGATEQPGDNEKET